MWQARDEAYLHDGGCLRELQRPLDSAVDSLMAARPQRQNRVVQHLRPARPQDPRKSQSDQRDSVSDPRNGQQSNSENSKGRKHGPSGSQSGTRVWSKKRATKQEREQQRKGARTIRRRRSNCRQPGRSAALRSRRPPSPKPAAERNKAPGAAERKKRRVG